AIRRCWVCVAQPTLPAPATRRSPIFATISKISAVYRKRRRTPECPRHGNRPSVASVQCCFCVQRCHPQESALRNDVVTNKRKHRIKSKARLRYLPPVSEKREETDRRPIR